MTITLFIYFFLSRPFAGVHHRLHQYLHPSLNVNLYARTHSSRPAGRSLVRWSSQENFQKHSWLHSMQFCLGPTRNSSRNFLTEDIVCFLDQKKPSFLFILASATRWKWGRSLYRLNSVALPTVLECHFCFIRCNTSYCGYLTCFNEVTIQLVHAWDVLGGILARSSV